MVKKDSFLATASIMSLYFLIMGLATVTPAIHNIMMAFPELPYTTVLLVANLPSLIFIPATLIAGMLAGRRVKYKTLGIIGILLFIIGGVAPAFINENFTVILIARAVFGIGLGFVTPLGNALVLALYEGQKRASMLGIGTVVMNVGGIVFQLLGGFLSGYKWYYVFYPHALAIISLILVVLFLPEPEKVVQEQMGPKQKIKIPFGVILSSVLFGFAMLCINPMLVNMSGLLVERGMGDSSVAALVLALYTVGGMIAGAIFSSMYRITKRFIIAIGLFIVAAGMGCIYYGGNVVVMAIGSGLVGLGFYMIMPAIFMIFGMIAEPSAFGISSSFLSTSMSIFTFLSTYWIGLIGVVSGDAVGYPIFIGMIIYVVAGIIFLFVNPIPKTGSAQKIEQ